MAFPASAPMKLGLQVGAWGAGGIVLLFALESAPMTGLFLPGILLMTGLGSLSATGQLSFGDALLYAALGCLMGDSLGYWIGRAGLHVMLGDSPRFRVHRARARRLVERHGAVAVFLGRFVWFFHPAVPPLAGAAGVRPWQFYLADVPAVLLWVTLYGALGHWATGVALERTIEFLSVVVTVLFLLLAWNLWRRWRRHGRA
ncbi:MAG: DedA family protein [Gammaproteobacteria bacterium]|nr:MAG: DedA family protein [Gammaproteobacteria bacterium]